MDPELDPSTPRHEVLEKLHQLEAELAKMKKYRKKLKRKSKKRRRRVSTSDSSESDHSNVSPPPEKISIVTDESAYDKNRVSPLVLKKFKQPCTANTEQLCTANALQLCTATSFNENTEREVQNAGESSTHVHFESLPQEKETNSINLNDTLAIFTDDNLTEYEEGREQTNEPETADIVAQQDDMLNDCNLPYVIDPFGPPIRENLSSTLIKVWEKKYQTHEMRPIWEKYPLPSNLGNNIVAPQMNAEVRNLQTKWQREYDIKWFNIQNSLNKCISAALKLNDLITDSELDRTKKTAALQHTIDMTQIISQVNTEISIKRRGFAKSNLPAEYKELCDKDRPITNFLFGDKISDDMKEINITKNLRQNSFLFRGRGRSRPYQQRAPHNPNYNNQKGFQPNFKPYQQNSNGKYPYKRRNYRH